MRALVAEDDPALRSVLERGLRENGDVVDAVADGTAAVRNLRVDDDDMAVVDRRMPERLRAKLSESGARTEIVRGTGYRMVET